jgi:hypothetical protein
MFSIALVIILGVLALVGGSAAAWHFLGISIRDWYAVPYVLTVVSAGVLWLLASLWLLEE